MWIVTVEWLRNNTFSMQQNIFLHILNNILGFMLLWTICVCDCLVHVNYNLFLVLTKRIQTRYKKQAIFMYLYCIPILSNFKVLLFSFEFLFIFQVICMLCLFFLILSPIVRSVQCCQSFLYSTLFLEIFVLLRFMKFCA